MINFNRVPCVYWNTKTKIEYLQRYILIHSILYYQMDTDCITDKEFDSISNQLVSMIKLYGQKGTMYEYCFKDFDGSTGFDLYGKLNSYDKQYLALITNLVYNLWRKEK